ncbi:hypothetical protein ABBQ38_011351 [Trebouxia sp. C0009 RCD-2024]
MLCCSLPPASLCCSFGTKNAYNSGLHSASRRCSRIPQAFFDRKESNGDKPQEDFLASSWGGEQPDWTESPEQRDVLEEVWYEDDASPEALAQNALAVALSSLLIWGFGSILWKLAVVSYALFAAAFRYSFVALVLLVVVVFLAA